MRRAVRFLGMVMCAVLIGGFGGNALAGPVSFKFAHFIPPNEPGAEVGLWIEKELNETAGDLVEAKYFHSTQMGSTIEIVNKVRMGTLQAGFLTSNYAPDLDPKFGIGTLAYCMESYEKWAALLNNDAVREELYTSLLPKGLRVVDTAYFGVYGLVTTKPVNSFDDLKAMKMRTTEARYPVAFWKALGVNPVPMAWGDVFPALKQGVVDGTDQTMNVARLRLTDVTKYFTETKHMLGLFFLVVNEKWYQKLDPKEREVIMGSIHRNFVKAREASMRLTEEAPAALKEKGVTVIALPDAEMAKFKEAQMQVWKQFEPEIGAEWLNKIKDLTKGM
ncbi:putative Extracellular solute-binding protein, family 7 [uncultured Desulfatiglans sp.]|uniref:Putative Extracellular solute-binding protein, family 7 n=1 Tax=Uncultured Desulfatiglans sp. TaxID=1748965 RepID=A0A653A3U3_UNCDX|nr:putative Extracellular solute-binding protein, family 7 [uncultured Desulfatiglans sp.]